MQVNPLNTLEELWNWTEPSTGSSKFTLMNYKNDKKVSGEPEVLICHDMRGGYLPEEEDTGFNFPADQKPYVFLNWWNIDVFCYFSHHFVTIPPSGYIEVAHKHGCLVMGTFITEWEDGENICEELLKSHENIEKTVDQLVKIALYYGFEGWLVNIENVIEETKVESMKTFLSLLTEGMSKHVPVSRVIWYDSVTSEGKLRWQDELNDLNRVFYDSCDGIYLNYNWDEESLLNSADFGTLNKIYVGIDVFGRGCIGEWDCNKSFRKVKYMRMSIALFAPGWICQTYPSLDPVANGIKFWDKLRNYTSQRSVTDLPLETNFYPGISLEKNTFCLSKIELQPLFDGEKIYPSEKGLLIREPGPYTLFNTSFKKNAITVELSSDDQDLKLLVNGEILSHSEKGEGCKIFRIEQSNISSIGIYVKNGSTLVKSLKIY